MEKSSYFLLFKKKAQTAAEVAVFGAILIFVIGLTVRHAMDAGYAQNQSLKAMRLAMKMSYEASEGRTEASRNVATVLFIEDRLTADSAKYGAIDRTPYMISASATHNRNLFLPVGFGSNDDLPVMDVFVNGKHFVFTTSAFKKVVFGTVKYCRDICDPSCLDCNATITTCNDNYGCWVSINPETFVEPGPGVDWDINCASYTVACNTVPLLCPCASASPCDASCTYGCSPFDPTQYVCGCTNASCTDCTLTSTQTFTRPVGCVRLYTIIDNHPLIPEWCDDVGDMCPATNLTADERFDLNRSGASFAAPFDPTQANPDVTGAALRKAFSWQWYLVMAFDVAENWLVYPQLNKAQLNKGEGITLEPSWCESGCQSSRNTAVDVDGDRKLEQVIQDTIRSDAHGIIASLGVIDAQDGDLDFSIDDSDTKPQSGFTQNVSMYTFVREGTYLQIKEGKLYSAIGDTRQYIRTTRKKDQIDLVEREFQLSNNTGRFCYNGSPTNWASPPNDLNGKPIVAGVGNLSNPVEVCVNSKVPNTPTCFSGPNIDKTCMDQNDDPNSPYYLKIFIRSRIASRHGRKWVTQTDVGDYIDLTPPSGL